MDLEFDNEQRMVAITTELAVLMDKDKELKSAYITHSHYHQKELNRYIGSLKSDQQQSLFVKRPCNGINLCIPFFGHTRCLCVSRIF